MAPGRSFRSSFLRSGVLREASARERNETGISQDKKRRSESPAPACPEAVLPQALSQRVCIDFSSFKSDMSDNSLMPTGNNH